ncbi:MAG TPA: hypothetical protein VFH22_02930, partial [Rhodocyclaceae bacterium]|nr:hypothetical protein [Rhodocyclaceae bacterium]
SAAIRATTASTALAPTDPHELARQRIVASPVTSVALRSTLATAAPPTIDPHERARRLILGIPVESGPVPHHSAAVAK